VGGDGHTHHWTCANETDAVNAELTIEYSPAIVTRAASRFLQRFFGVSGTVSLTLLWLIFGVLVAAGYHGWFTIALATFLFTSTVFFGAVFVIYRRRAVAGLRRFVPPEVTFVFTDEGFSSKSSVGESFIRWQAVQKLWRFPEVWLLFVSDRQYVTFPVEQVPDDLRDHIAKKIQSTGAKIQ